MLDWGGWLTPRHAPAAVLWGKRLDTHCVGGWVGPRCGLDECGKSSLHRDFYCILLYSLCTSFVLVSLSSLSCILPFVFTYNTQHKHPCPRRDSNPQTQQAISVDPLLRPLGHWDLRHWNRFLCSWKCEFSFLWKLRQTWRHTPSVLRCSFRQQQRARGLCSKWARIVDKMATARRVNARDVRP